MPKLHPLFAASLIFAAFSSLIGNQWGLPSRKRAELVLPKTALDETFYQKLAEARSKIYEAREINPSINMKDLVFTKEERSQVWRPIPEKFLIHSYSSYLVRSMDGDEQLALSTLAQINPDQGRWLLKNSLYGAVYIYPLGAFLKAFQIAGILRLTSDITYYYKNQKEMGRIFSVGRLFSAITGLLLLGILYLLGCAVFDGKTAGLACLLLAATPPFLYLSHSIKPHLLAGALALIVFFYALKVFKDQNRSDYLKGGLWAGLALGTATNTYPMMLALPFAHLFKSKKFKNLFLYGILAAAVFLAANFWILLNFREFYELQRDLARAFTPSFNPFHLAFFGFKTWSASLGIPLLIFTAAGIAFSLKGRWGHAAKFSAAFLIFYLFWFCIQFTEHSRYYPARYIMAAFGLAALFASKAALEMVKTWKFPAYGIALACILYQAGIAVCYLENFRQDNPAQAVSIRAGNWIHANIPAGSTVSTYLPTLDLVPPFRFQDYKIYDLPNLKRVEGGEAKNLPEFLILSMNPPYAEMGFDPRVHRDPFENFSQYYEPVQEFRRETCAACRLLRFQDYFTSANYPFFIYRRKI